MPQRPGHSSRSTRTALTLGSESNRSHHSPQAALEVGEWANAKGARPSRFALHENAVRHHRLLDVLLADHAIDARAPDTPRVEIDRDLPGVSLCDQPPQGRGDPGNCALTCCLLHPVLLSSLGCGSLRAD